MKYQKSGFSILLMFLLMGAFAVIAGTYIHTGVYLNTLALERQEREYQYWAAYGLLQYASAVYGTKKEVPQDPIRITHWPDANSPYEGRIQLADAGELRSITVQLINKGTVLQTISQRVALML